MLASTRAVKAPPHLFVQVMPTPNGRLHLGHMSGPYLKADILARHLRLRGVEAHVISGADSYESHVELKAAQTGSTEHAVATRFHGLIEQELAALRIDSVFTDPLRPDLHDEYVAFNRRTLDQLARQGGVETLREKVAYSPSLNRYGAGCWISGTCPQCGAGSGSYFCEACGGHYKPEDLRDARCTFDATDVREVEVESLFLRLRRRQQLDARIERMGIPPGFHQILTRYIEAQGERVRLTNPGRWGMPYGPGDGVIFTYTTGLLSFSLFCAELFKRAHGLEKHPFAPDSDYVTVATFGIDNTVAYLAGVLGAAVEWDDIKPYDYFLTNHFYNLEGRKFSTSRNHLVCARDLVTGSGVSPDAIRYFLGKVNPEAGPKDFIVSEFVDVNNRVLAGGLEALLSRAFAHVRTGAVDAPSDNLMRELDRVLEEQASHLRLPTTHLARAAGCIDAWRDVGERLDASDATAEYWWLKGFSMVAAPFMPDVSQRIWALLGHGGAPRLESFTERPVLERPPVWTPAFESVSAAAVERSVHREAARSPGGKGARE
ncbi:class I tRNA ligase family protein [Corallococcus carmarthensis]|uniref:Methionyl/Leucyl tRNA synthetase domain-containing protein n=1 Tax=Corallococcus carmarthensis TaxID=2316728 RepID=A0A3A8KT08_9BACT|nr:class I tRNA ligase family protein [Corallococcus carmarthensis]NOK15697.1 class I tRNA ligase family protein [Corallococcus carmarthensis]RKH07381.1 hypothetical protein D7X32_02095 [Corallococcus carmarthensis]